MVAMAATIAAVYPHMNHLGGDGFWLIREPSAGFAPSWRRDPPGRNARPELYRDYETIPPRGPLAALTVPGAVGGWMLALRGGEGARRHAAARCAASPSAIGHARDGYRVTRSQERLTRGEP